MKKTFSDILNYQKGGPSGRGTFKSYTLKVKSSKGGRYRGATVRCGNGDPREVCKIAAKALNDMARQLANDDVISDEEKIAKDYAEGKLSGKALSREVAREYGDVAKSTRKKRKPAK